MSYDVKQDALQSNDTGSSSIAPSFLPQAMPSLLFQALSPYAYLTCSGMESGVFKSFDMTWPAGLEEQSAPSRALPQTTCSRIQMAVGKKKRLIVCSPIFSIRKIKRIAAFAGKSQG